MPSLAGSQTACRRSASAPQPLVAAAARGGWRAAGGRIRLPPAAPAPAPCRRRGVRVAAEAGPSSSELAQYIAFHRTAEELSTIKGRMAGLQAGLEAQLAAVEQTQAALHALRAAAGGGGGARAAAEASLYSAVAGSEEARLRRLLAQQSAQVDGTLSEMRALEGQLDEAKAGRTAAYADKLEGLAAAIAAKHAGATQFAADAPAAVHAAVLAALEADIVRLGRLAVGARLSDDGLAKQAGAARAVAEGWRLHAAARRIAGEGGGLADEGFARAEAFAARVATLAAQRARLSAAIDAVRGHMTAVEQAAEDARAARDTARDAEAAAAAEAAAVAAAEALAGGDPLAQEAALRGLRCAVHAAAAARKTLLDRHAAAAAKAEHWHQEWRRLAQAAWAHEGGEDAEAAAGDCLQRRTPYAARATALQLHLDSTAEAAAHLSLGLRIAEARLAEALAAAAAAQAAGRDDGLGGAFA